MYLLCVAYRRGVSLKVLGYIYVGVLYKFTEVSKILFTNHFILR